MNRYPLWKNLIIVISLVLGLLYTLPNFFGESPAIQISPLRVTTTAVNPELIKKVEDSLRKASIASNGTIVEGSSIKVRFAETETQIKAKDLLQAELGNDYIVALNLIPNSPDWLSSIGALPMYLGLDLRGGVHFMLQVDMLGALTKALDRYSADIRSSLREQKISFSGIERERGQLTIKFRDEPSRSKGETELKRI